VSTRAKIGEEHHQDERIQWRFHESVVLVEVLGILILGVNQEHPDANGLRDLDGLEHEVLQEGRTKTSALVSPIHAHPCQENGWHFLGLIATDLFRRRRPKNRRRRGSVEGDDLTGADLDNDPGAARTGRLISECPLNEPVVERARSAVECLETMFAGEKFRAGVGHYAGRSSTDGLVSSLIIAGGSEGGSERSSCNSIQAPSSTTNTRRSANSISAAWTACRRT